MSLDLKKKQEEDITLQNVLGLIDQCVEDIKKGYQDLHFEPALTPARSLREIAAMRINALLYQVDWREGDGLDKKIKMTMRHFEIAGLTHKIKMGGRHDPLGCLLYTSPSPRD